MEDRLIRISKMYNDLDDKQDDLEGKQDELDKGESVGHGGRSLGSGEGEEGLGSFAKLSGFDIGISHNFIRLSL